MSIKSAEALVTQMWPHSANHASTIVDLNIRIGEELSMGPDSDPELFAVALANVHGAFPWNGPYGNGLTKKYYQGRFRQMALEHIAILSEVAK